MAMERSQTPVEMNVRRRAGQALPSDSSQFVDESGSGDIFSVTVVHQRQDGSRFIVAGLVFGYDNIGVRIGHLWHTQRNEVNGGFAHLP